GGAGGGNSAPLITSGNTFSVTEGNTSIGTVSATDSDGDSLVYSLSIPMSGFSSPNFPVPDGPTPASNPGTDSPYPTVDFLAGYNINNMVRGTPALAISESGFLTVTPSETGLYVFAVKCEEYRDGVKIGEVRRDFQMLVIDCIDRDPPVLSFENEPPNVNSTTLTFQAGDVDTCLIFEITDPNVDTELNVNVTPITHSTNNGITFNFLTSSEIGPGETARFEVCIPGCTEIIDEIYQFEVRVSDNTCALPLWDTATVTLDVRAPLNNPPEDSLRTVGFDFIEFNPSTGCYDANLLVGDTLRFGIDAFDSDNDSLWVYAFSSSVNLEAEGFATDTILGEGIISTDFEWIPTCTNLPLGEQERNIEISMIVADLWNCGVRSRDTICININLGQPPFENVLPELTWEDGESQLEDVGDVICDTILVDETISFTIVGEDPDTTELVRLSVIPDGFTLAGLGMSFENREKTLNPGGTTISDTIASVFSWTPDCNSLNGATEQAYFLDFILEDENGCQFKGYDTLRVKIIVQDLPQPETGAFPNAFSPNDDGINDAFTINNLPIDNCADVFLSITIYDRWGKKVFEGPDRSFAWTGEDHPSGTYYYHVNYQNSDYRGTVQLLRSGQ
ncbi:MAG: gliding motility-associated C-terminal domain-containing protein, partial [Flammeovirgaceae bacterium]